MQAWAFVSSALAFREYPKERHLNKFQDLRLRFFIATKISKSKQLLNANLGVHILHRSKHP